MEADIAVQILSGNDLSLNTASKFGLHDSITHSAALMEHLDPVEKDLKKRFSDMTISAEEYNQYTNRIGNFPRRGVILNKAEGIIGDFMSIIKTLQRGKVSKTILGTFIVHLLDHYYREEAYYLYKMGLPGPDPTIVSI